MNLLPVMVDSRNLFVLVRCMIYNLYKTPPSKILTTKKACKKLLIKTSLSKTLLNKIFSQQQILTRIIWEILHLVLCVIWWINLFDIVVKTAPKVFHSFCLVLLRKSPWRKYSVNIIISFSKQIIMNLKHPTANLKPCLVFSKYGSKKILNVLKRSEEWRTNILNISLLRTFFLKVYNHNYTIFAEWE